MNKYRWLGFATIGVAALIALVIVFAGDEEGRVIQRAVGLFVTVPIAIVFFPVFIRVIRGHRKDGTPIELWDLFGAGTAMFSGVFAMGIMRSVFFDTRTTCGDDTTCIGIFMGVWVIGLAAALFFKMITTIGQLYPTDSRARVVISLGIGAALAVAALLYGFDQLPG